MPAPPVLKPAFEKIEGEPPDTQHAGPVENPTFVRVSVNDGVPRWLKLSAAIDQPPLSGPGGMLV